MAAEGGQPVRDRKDHELQFQNEIRLRAVITSNRAELFAQVGGKWVLLAEHEDPTGQLTKGRFGLRDVNELMSFSHTDR